MRTTGLQANGFPSGSLTVVLSRLPLRHFLALAVAFALPPAPALPSFVMVQHERKDTLRLCTVVQKVVPERPFMHSYEPFQNCLLCRHQCHLALPGGGFFSPEISSLPVEQKWLKPD